MTLETQSQVLTDAERRRSLKAAVCRETVNFCTEQFGDRLQAIILTGSMARDEATFVFDQGQCAVLGDAEFLVVFKDHVPLPGADDIKHLSRRVSGALLQQSLDCSIELSEAHSEYLRKLQPHIFAYELRECGEVLWGDPAILSLIPKFGAEEISLEDGWRMVNNRIIELLGAVGKLAHQDSLAAHQICYKAAKLYLDTATSFLLFRGCYAPTYQLRLAQLNRLAAQSGQADLPFPLPRFAHFVGMATAWKVCASGAEIPDAGEFLASAFTHAARILRWEANVLSGAPPSDAEATGIRPPLPRQSWRQRARGWAYVARAEGWWRAWRQWPRWTKLAWGASPRYWVYAAANALLGEMPSLLHAPGGADVSAAAWRPARAWLPMKCSQTRSEVLSWQEFAAEIEWNYRRFLTGTRA